MCKTHVCVLLYAHVHVQMVVSQMQASADLQQGEQGLTGAHHTRNGSLLRSIVMLLQLFPQTVRHPTAPATAISHATVLHADHALLQPCHESDSSGSQEAVIL